MLSLTVTHIYPYKMAITCFIRWLVEISYINLDNLQIKFCNNCKVVD